MSLRQDFRNEHQLWTFTRQLSGILSGLLLLTACASATATPSPTPAATSNERALGPADAPVTLVEYGDLGCTTCRAWYNSGVLDQIRAKYGDQVRFVWRDFPVITALSPKAAEAGWCAQDQNKFWEFHDLVYAKFQIDEDSLKADAAQLGLDTARFSQCLDSGQHQQDVKREWQDAQAHGFRATPSFLINDQTFIGPPTFDQLVSLIDPMLAARN